MSGGRGVLIVAVAMYAAAALQMSVGQYTLAGGRFEFLLAMTAVLCMYTSRTGGAATGFVDGWLLGSLTGANMWQYTLTRAVGGYVVSLAYESGIERSPFSAFLAGGMLVLLSQIGLMFLAPPPQIMPFLGDTIRTAVYNGVLAVLVYTLLNRIVSPRR